MGNTEFNQLTPSHFEWLDLAEEFFKQNGNLDYGHERNGQITRNGTIYKEIEAEYRQLEKLNLMDPEHFAEPSMAIKKDGEIQGFYIEKVEGVDLQEYLRNNQDIEENKEIIRELKDIVDEMENHGYVHGDLANNGIYNPETGELKFIDPVGIPQTEEDWEKMKELDNSDLELLENTAYQPYAKFIEPV